jgi:hypothetical protein
VVHGAQGKVNNILNNNTMAKATKKISVAEISKLAKQIRKKGEAWTDAIKRASAQLKK